MIDLLSRLTGVRANGKHGWTACCPAHEDRKASLSVKNAAKGWLVHCHAGCPTDAVCAALGLEVRQLFHEPREPRQRLHKGAVNGSAVKGKSTPSRPAAAPAPEPPDIT